MNKHSVIALGLVLGAMDPGHVLAYDIPTHYDLASAGFNRSRLKLDRSLVPQLGLGGLYENRTFPASAGKDSAEFDRQCQHGLPLIIERLIACGAQFEDYPGTRSFNHFYDPLLERPLTVGGVKIGLTSPDWILQDAGAVPSSEQKFAYRNARDYEYQALIAASAGERERNWGLTFETLGHVVHHLEDMAQPQHVRNDEHVDKPWLIGLYAPSSYETFTRTIRGSAKSIMEESAASASVYSEAFTKPRDFWKGVNGLADSTNKRFLSAGTNFSLFNGGPVANATYPAPAVAGEPEHMVISKLDPLLDASVRDYCGSYCEMTFYPTATSRRASTLSLFDQDVKLRPVSYTDTGFQTYRADRLFALNRFNFMDAYPLLLPQAVSYSAGLLDYFFRGKISIALPQEGVYGLLDHAAVQVADPSTGFAGFGKIKVNLANLSSEAMGAGKLSLLMAFRRNLCFTDDLSRMPPVGNADECVSSKEETVVSGEQTIGGLPSSATPFTFAFPKAMPLNAVYVRLQVVFRGVLGAESDAVVSSLKNISEPTFVSVMNDTDYIALGGKMYRRDDINGNDALLALVQPASCVLKDEKRLKSDCLQPVPLQVNFSFGATTMQAADVQAGSYIRFAYLVDAPDVAGAGVPAQDGSPTCNPAAAGAFNGLSPSKISPALWESIYSPEADVIRVVTPSFTPHRGVTSWYQMNCVYFGDNRAPSHEPGWDEGMSPASPTPVQLSINGGVGF